MSGRVSLSDVYDTGEEYCAADGCHLPATDERLDGVDETGNWHYELVCVEHSRPEPTS